MEPIMAILPSTDTASLAQLDDLSLCHIMSYLTVDDIKNLSKSCPAFHELLNSMFTVSLPFPLDQDFMDNQTAWNKPVLEIVTRGVTDKLSRNSTNKQINKINSHWIKELRLECPLRLEESEDSEACLESCSDYHQRLLYNLYHGHWKRGTSFNVEKLHVTVCGKVERLTQAMASMPRLSHINLQLPITMEDLSWLIEGVIALPSARTVSITILPSSKTPKFGNSLKLKSTNLRDLSLNQLSKSCFSLPIREMKLPRLETLLVLPEVKQEADILLKGDLSGTRNRLRLVYRGCTRLTHYNGVFIGDIRRNVGFDDWVLSVANRIKKEKKDGSTPELLS